MIKSIKIDDLLLDMENPRISNPESQGETLQQLIANQGEKILKLATDIAIMGTNPADLPIVIPDEVDGKFVILEGNRRLAAIKLLQDQSSLEQISNLNLRLRFAQLQTNNRKNRIHEIDCLIMNNRSEAEHWIELRHTGENNGVGIVPWNSEASSRFLHQRGRKSYNDNALNLQALLEKSERISKSTKNKLKSVGLTNLSRLVNDKDVRKKIGISIKNNDVIVDLSNENTLSIISAIIDDLSDPNFNVHKIYSKQDREKYISKLVPEFLT